LAALPLLGEVLWQCGSWCPEGGTLPQEVVTPYNFIWKMLHLWQHKVQWWHSQLHLDVAAAA